VVKVSGRSAVDRDYLARGRPGLLDELRADAATRVLPIWNGRTRPAPSGPPALGLLPAAEVPVAETWLYLGCSLDPASPEPVGTPLLGAVLTEESALALAPAEEWLGVRELGAVLGQRDAELLLEAVALANWHASHRFSPRTGELLVPEQGGWVLRAAGDAAEVFPRTDPAIIVVVLDADDRILLGSNALWQRERYSLLAGFVEPGESLEAAVVREIAEESGIRVIDPVYVGSQSWPFPSSLMVGFRALAEPGQGDPVPDGAEILDLRWFTREELRDAADVILPGPASIARAMIDDWLGDP
jgi:NAD+ diphosphatase